MSVLRFLNAVELMLLIDTELVQVHVKHYLSTRLKEVTFGHMFCLIIFVKKHLAQLLILLFMP